MPACSAQRRGGCHESAGRCLPEVGVLRLGGGGLRDHLCQQFPRQLHHNLRGAFTNRFPPKSKTRNGTWGSVFTVSSPESWWQPQIWGALAVEDAGGHPGPHSNPLRARTRASQVPAGAAGRVRPVPGTREGLQWQCPLPSPPSSRPRPSSSGAARAVAIPMRGGRH